MFGRVFGGLVLGAALVAGPALVSAQDFDGLDFGRPGGGARGQSILQGAIQSAERNAPRRPEAAPPARRSTPAARTTPQRTTPRATPPPRPPQRTTPRATTPTPPPAQVAAVVTTYRRNMTVSRQVQRDLLSGLRQSSPEVADVLQTIMAENDFIELWNSAMAEYGLRPNDLTDSFAAYWVYNWSVVNDVDDVPRTQVEAVRRQVKTAFASTPMFSSATEVERQQLSETMMLQVILMAIFDEMGKQAGDDSVKQALQVAAYQSMEALGMDLTQFQLTDEGFVTI
jgi:hypothetical protein